MTRQIILECLSQPVKMHLVTMFLFSICSHASLKPFSPERCQSNKYADCFNCKDSNKIKERAFQNLTERCMDFFF